MQKFLFLSLSLFSQQCFAQQNMDVSIDQMDIRQNIHIEKVQNFTQSEKDTTFRPSTLKSGLRNNSVDLKPQVKPSYFQSIQRMDLADCVTGRVDLDSICQTAVVHYQNYVVAVNENLSKQQCTHLYTVHKRAVEHYVLVYQLIAHQEF